MVPPVLNTSSTTITLVPGFMAATYILAVLCLLAVVPFAGMWHFTSPSVYYRPLMLQSLMLLYLLTALLFEDWGGFAKDAAGLLLAVIVFNNAVMTNIAYFHMQVCYERTYAGAVEMAVEIHNVQDREEFADFAVIGNRYDKFLWPMYDAATGQLTRPGDMYILTGLLEQNLLVDQIQITQFLSHNLGLTLPVAGADKATAISASEAFAQMPVWPAEGSLAVIDNTLVMKIS